MLLFLLAFLGGVLTILSPCILPVLPFVFARADQSFRRSTLPMLGGMAITFAGVAALATAGGSWVVRGNQWGRGLALVILAGLGLSLLLPQVAEVWTRPLVRLGRKLQAKSASSVVLGVAVGLLWAPCAGPILGLVLAAAALSGFSAHAFGLLLAFALGAACSLAVALLAGQRVFRGLKRSLGAEAWVRRGLGMAVLAGVVAIALGADTSLLSTVQYVNTNGLEQRLVGALDHPQPVHAAPITVNLPMPEAAPQTVALDREGAMPSLNGATAWINTPPLTASALRGKVVLVDFWTYSCINCLRSLPFIEAWAKKYGPEGLVVVGVHSPEFAFERDTNNVREAVNRLKLTFPVAVDSDHKIWNAFQNEYWPADYFVDAGGQIRFHHFGEGSYAESERVIQQLLAEAHHQAVGPVSSMISGTVDGAGAEAPAMPGELRSPETYIGYERGERFASPEKLATDHAAKYSAPLRPTLNQWGLAGRWEVGPQTAVLKSPTGAIIYRFHARDLHLVLGSPDGKPIRFKVTIDGTAPGPDHGVDVAPDGSGTATFHRLYQLVRQHGAVEDRTFEIEFLDPGVQAYAFTFG